MRGMARLGCFLLLALGLVCLSLTAQASASPLGQKDLVKAALVETRNVFDFEAAEQDERPENLVYVARGGCANGSCQLAPAAPANSGVFGVRGRVSERRANGGGLRLRRLLPRNWGG